MLEHITASEIAGYGVGALLLSATLSAPKIDSFISSSQRSSLGMCKRCGDLKLVACFKCKGSGLIKEGGPFNFVPIVSENRAFPQRLTDLRRWSTLSCAPLSPVDQGGVRRRGWEQLERLPVSSSGLVVGAEMLLLSLVLLRYLGVRSTRLPVRQTFPVVLADLVCGGVGGRVALSFGQS
ncbi:Unknown protein [Striga hermonthica]|uniref:Uncharacterized protein n=1 Tax=Striga hermonthica TaxID=68872 RepID=A0A9N7N5A3_STRHE|nr:Unknown protein [Striga hermonthica]